MDSSNESTPINILERRLEEIYQDFANDLYKLQSSKKLKDASNIKFVKYRDNQLVRVLKVNTNLVTKVNDSINDDSDFTYYESLFDDCVMQMKLTVARALINADRKINELVKD